MRSYQQLLAGGAGAMGRYGQPIGSALPGGRSGSSPLSLNRAFAYNGDVNGGTYWSNFQTIYDAHGSPPDYQTFGIEALDRAGRPLHISMGGQIANGPYDIDLTRNAPHAVDLATANNPYSVAELERILRPYDRDTGTLQQRLYNLTSNGNGSILESRRAELTTESWMSPVASAVLPPALRGILANGRSVHPVDILEANIRLNGGSLNNLNALRMQLLPWEILQGLKMDINRPFGAGGFSMNPSYQGQLTTGGQPTVPDQPGQTGGSVPQLTSPGAPPLRCRSTTRPTEAMQRPLLPA